MNIWLISFFEPTPYDKQFSTRFINIADELVERGHRITFFNSTFRHSSKKQRFDKTTRVNVRKNYDLVFINTQTYKNNISLSRAISHSRLSRELIREINKEDELPDIIFMAYPPISTAHKITKWANMKSVPYIVDIIDPWPEDFRKVVKSMPKKIQDLILSPFLIKAGKVLKGASAVSGIAKQRLEWAKTFEPKTDEFHYFYPSADLKVVQAKLNEISTRVEKDDKLRVIYAGSFGSSYDIPTILEAARLLSKDYTNKIEFVIAGAGPQESKINAYVKKYENLRFVGRLSKEELMEEYYKSDLGLIQHFPKATQTVTYKLFDLMSCGLPILNSLESELNDIVLQNKVGLYNISGDSQKLAENILFFYNNPVELTDTKERAINLTAKIGDTSVVYSRLADLIEKISVESN